MLKSADGQSKNKTSFGRNAGKFEPQIAFTAFARLSQRRTAR
jgi:hypothetical protein